MDDAEKLEQSEVLKKRAGELFKDGHYRAALKKYTTITEYLQSPKYDDDDKKKKADELKLSAQSNVALCHLKLNEHAECIRACDKALEIDPKNEKCLFRRGQCHQSMSNHEDAIKDFQEVLTLNPANSAAKQSIQKCRDDIKAYQQKEKQLYANIFAKLAKQSEKAEPMEATNGDAKAQEGETHQESTPTTTA